MYGGFDTTARSPRSLTGPSSEPCRRETAACSTLAQRRTLLRATLSASSETSVAITCSNTPSLARASAMAPDPVPTSTATPPLGARVSSRTISTSCSVSGRGMSTRSSTSSVRCRKAARPAAYCSGAPRARRAAAARARSQASALIEVPRSSSGQWRGMSCSAARSSRASRSASWPNAGVSSRAISLVSAPSERGASRASPTELLLHVGKLERVDHRLDVAVHHARQVVRGEADAMIGEAALRKVVGADLRRAVARAHLQLAHARAFGLLLRHAQVEQPRAQHFHGFQLVLQLGFLVLLRDDEPRRDVRDAYGAIRRVHRLSARATGAEHVDPQVLVLDLHVHLLRF